MNSLDGTNPARSVQQTPVPNSVLDDPRRSFNRIMRDDARDLDGQILETDLNQELVVLDAEQSDALAGGVEC